MDNDEHRHVKGDGSYWLRDARGIELCRACPGCETQKLAKYRPEVLTNPNYEADEDIDPDDMHSVACQCEDCHPEHAWVIDIALSEKD